MAQKGECGPLQVFPEGCTTNGKYLIQFKKGAFASLKPVKPLINITKSTKLNQTRGDVMNIWHWSFLVPFAGIFTQTELLEMPVFAPNEYFWKNYWDGKDPEIKW